MAEARNATAGGPTSCTPESPTVEHPAVTTELHTMSLLDLRDAIATRRVSALDAARAALARADVLQPRINAFTEVFHERAIEQAAQIDARLARGETVGPLAGVPLAIKDNLCLSWGKTTCASRMLAEYRSPYTATAVQRVLDAGAVMIGKTNLDEFAMGSGTERSFFGATKNPWDLSRVPGGSSGGSAACVAAGIVPGALGSDTGGSIRQPAAMCNIVGLKPAYGRVSRFGLVAYASSLDQVGPLTRTVADAALLAGVLAGHDPLDSTSLDEVVPDYAGAVRGALAGGLKDRSGGNVRIGVPIQARSAANHPGVSAALENAIGVLRGLGAEVVDVDLKHAEHGIAAYYIIALAEASSNLARFDGIRYGQRARTGAGEDLFDLYCRSRAEGLGAEVQRRIMLGTHVLSSGYHEAYYTTALKVRRKIRGDFDGAFAAGCHALLMPASPSPAWKIGAKSGDPLAEYLEDVYTVGVNLAGLPAVSVPAGFAAADGVNLPVGMQFIGPSGDEAGLLGIAAAFERETHFADRRPQI